MIQHAFKEWAVVCQALAQGRQSLILRKGGIAEEAGVFRPEHSSFWLYPTFVHQQRDGIKDSAHDLLESAELQRPPHGTIRLSHFAVVQSVHYIDRLDTALALDRLHVWSMETVRKRLAYREPGLYVLAVRVYRVPTFFDVIHKPEYDGCKTWVQLDAPPSEDGATAVLDDARLNRFLEELESVLNPRVKV